MTDEDSSHGDRATIMRAASFDALELPGDAIVVVDSALPDAWIDALPDPIVVEAGEGLKRLESIEALAGQVLARRSTRPLTLVGIGGGSVGDAVGFLASILWRGVELWHVPTTLLAMVDSAHGGKTAVNLGEAKNQLGTFYPAARVVLVDEALDTLPLEQRRDGLAELVKGLWLGDAEALDLLEADGGVGELAAAPFDAVGERLMTLLERAIAVKLDIVDRDLYETKEIRTFLNLGHTVAHTLELHTGISHGQAVCWGMLAASYLSSARAGLSEAQAARLRSHLYALLTPSQAIAAFRNREQFCAGIKRDKKRIDGQLRSVLLDGLAEPLVTREISADDWFDTFRQGVEWFEATPALLRLDRPRAASLDIAASKSEMNRALVIAHLRPGETQIEGDSSADDVAWLRRCLAQLRQADGPVEIYCGEGGTTFRFLTAVCAARADETMLLAASRLLDRPHEALFAALRAAGASVDMVDGDSGRGVRIRGWSTWPERLKISAELSSQYASALALLAGGGESFTLELTGGGMASRPYFEMTLDLLREAGVAVEQEGTAFRFAPTPELGEPCTLHAETDASSAAVWAFARLVGVEAEVANPPKSGRQPDAGASEIAARMAVADGSVEIDLQDAPDLAPVLAAAATQLDARVDIVGAAHLRHKESDRIGDLAEAFAAVGITIEPREDGIRIPAGRQQPQTNALWPTFGDHRLAMAALLLTAAGTPLRVAAPMVVSKSYPSIWHDARRLGWKAEGGGGGTEGEDGRVNIEY